MIDLEKILRENPNGVLATRNGDGVATRIFQFLFMEDGNKVYFCTENDKPVIVPKNWKSPYPLP